MFPLWKDKRMVNPIKNFQRPSPKHIKYIPCFAQSKIPYLNKNALVFSTPFNHKLCHFIKGISLFISSRKTLEGSMTVEASIVLPLFFFFFLNIGGAIEMIRLHGNLELALRDVGTRMAVYGHMLMPQEEESADSLWMELAGVALSGTYVKGQIIDYLGKDYLESSPLKDGTDSLWFPESDVWEGDGTFEIVVTYSVSPVSALAGFGSFRMANKYYGHFWTGYAVPTYTDAAEPYVYVTETGEVYHLTNACTHLKLSIEAVDYGEAVSSRNVNGEKYEACEKCCDGIAVGNLYITSEGDCYHFKRDCPGLKRTVYYVPVSQVRDYRVCSRCKE